MFLSVVQFVCSQLCLPLVSLVIFNSGSQLHPRSVLWNVNLYMLLLVQIGLPYMIDRHFVKQRLYVFAALCLSAFACVSVCVCVKTGLAWSCPASGQGETGKASGNTGHSTHDPSIPMPYFRLTFSKGLKETNISNSLFWRENLQWNQSDLEFRSNYN